MILIYCSVVSGLFIGGTALVDVRYGGLPFAEFPFVHILLAAFCEIEKRMTRISDQKLMLKPNIFCKILFKGIVLLFGSLR